MQKEEVDFVHLLFCEKVVKGHFGLDLICVGVADKAGGCHHCQVDGLSCLADGAEHFDFFFKVLKCAFFQ